MSLELVPLGFEYVPPARPRSAQTVSAPHSAAAPRPSRLDWTAEVETAIREGRALPLLRLGDYVELRDSHEIGRVERLDGVLTFVCLGEHGGCTVPTTRSRVRLVAAARTVT